jgi:hypothetical protein
MAVRKVRSAQSADQSRNGGHVGAAFVRGESRFADEDVAVGSQTVPGTVAVVVPVVVIV